MGLIVNSVGDAACISIINNSLDVSSAYQIRNILSRSKSKYCTNCCNIHNKQFIEINDDFPEIDLVIDYGSFRTKTDKQIRKAKSFLLTHFHRDHYLGFEKKIYGQYYYTLNNQLNFNNFYYQSLPLFDDYEIHRRAGFLCTIGSIFRLILNTNGCLNINFENIDINATNKQPVCWPRDIINDDYEVIWPLCSLQNDDSSNIKKYVAYIEEFINSLYRGTAENSKYPIFKECEKIFESCITVKNERIDLYAAIKQFSLLLLQEKNIGLIYGILKFMKSSSESELRNKIKSIANKFSVCLYKKGEFLSLGDLENEDINPCISHFLTTHHLQEVDVKYLITAHHGTHWDTECRNIKADYVISSNGSRSISAIKRQLRNHNYNNCGYNYIESLNSNANKSLFSSTIGLHNTYCKGDFVDL